MKIKDYLAYQGEQYRNLTKQELKEIKYLSTPHTHTQNT